jgi:GMP synthase (glutamine-hydrolysing)
MTLTLSPQILVVSADPALAGSLVRRIREFGVSAVARSEMPVDGLPACRGIVVADAAVDIPAAAAGSPPVLAIGDGFAALLRSLPDLRWRPLGTPLAGFGTVRVDDRSQLWQGTDLPFSAWFRRSRVLERAPDGYRITAWDAEGHPIGLDDETGRRFAVQFHPQRSGSEAARQMLRRFVREICGCTVDWRLPEQVSRLIAHVRDVAGTGPVVVLISGGVASMVTAALVHRALGADRVLAVHADTGLLRQGESERVLAAALGLDLHRVELTDVADTLWPLVRGDMPPAGRQTVVAQCLLAMARQTAGRGGFGDQPVFVGSVDPWPEATGILAPLQAFDRSEWVQVGRALGVPDEILVQTPFPLAGLADRCDGELTERRLETLRRADARVMDDLARLGGAAPLTHVAVRLTVPAPGREALIIEACQADDGLAVQPFEAAPGFWSELAERLRGALPGVRHVYLDLAPSPAGSLTR